MLKVKSYKNVTEQINKDLMPESCLYLLKALADKDMYTYLHSWYTADYAVLLASALQLPNPLVKELYIAGWLHDIGKLLISNSILQKPARLTNDEYVTIREHVNLGLSILGNLELSHTVIDAIKQHHERWDGSGYPSGISGNDISIEGRIIQIADAFSAVTIKRLYRKPLSFQDALKEIRQNSGTQFDPNFIKTFSDVMIKKIAI